MDFLLPFFDWTSDPTAWVALLTLVVLEVVLGIDNLIFISILTNKLPEGQRVAARRLGISAALATTFAANQPNTPPGRRAEVYGHSELDAIERNAISAGKRGFRAAFEPSARPSV